MPACAHDSWLSVEFSGLPRVMSASVTDEIALFIDFENIRYSLINVQRREPDPQELIGLARRFGTVMVPRTYADWTRQPDFFKASLRAARTDRVDCPAQGPQRVVHTFGA